MATLLWLLVMGGSIAGTHAAASCAVGCTQRGNCNPHTGSCECPFGLAGPACEQVLVSACKLDASPDAEPILPCSSIMPKSCACIQQCKRLMCDSTTPGLTDLQGVANSTSKAALIERLSRCPQAPSLEEACFTRPDLTDDQQTSVVPSSEELAAGTVKFWSNASAEAVPVEGDTVLLVGGRGSRRAVHLSACPSSCYSRGVCRHKPGGTPGESKALSVACRCLPGYHGPACAEQHDVGGVRQACLDNCSGRGRCVFGFCHCKAGFWGPACGYPVAPDAAGARPTGQGKALKLHVYSLPAHIAWQPAWAFSSNYAAEQLFLARLMQDNKTLTDNPATADLFIVPALVSELAGITAWHAQHAAHVARVISWIKNEHVWWNRSQGRDHVIWATDDLGPVRWGHLTPDLAAPIKISHFGHTAGNKSNKVLRSLKWHGFRAGWDIVAAPHDPLHPPEPKGAAPEQGATSWHRRLLAALDGKGGRADALREAHQLLDSKRLTLFFSGTFWWPGVRDERKYSLGMRQALAAWAANFSALNCPAGPTQGEAAPPIRANTAKPSMASSRSKQKPKASTLDGVAGERVRRGAHRQLRSTDRRQPLAGAADARKARGWSIREGHVGGLPLNSTLSQTRHLDLGQQQLPSGSRSIEPYVESSATRQRRQLAALGKPKSSELDQLVGEACGGVLVQPYLGSGYMAAVTGSVFCAAPAGWGWGIRLTTAMVHGCIPVVFEDGVRQPWDEMLPYNRFSLCFTREEVLDGRMFGRLQRLVGEVEGREELAGMLLEAARHSSAFLWDEASGGTAYEHTLNMLAARSASLRRHQRH